MSLGSIGIYGSRSIRPLSASTPCDKKREASVHNSQRVGHTAKAANAESATDGCERASTSSNARTIEFWSVHTALGARDALESVCGSQTAERTVQAIQTEKRGGSVQEASHCARRSYGVYGRCRPSPGHRYGRARRPEKLAAPSKRAGIEFFVGWDGEEMPKSRNALKTSEPPTTTDHHTTLRNPL